MVSSSVLVYMILRNPREKNKNKSYHRIMLGMSICDICASTAWFFSTWLEPVGSAIGAVGTQATCSLQGFFVQLDVTTIFYSGTLSLYYLLILVYKWENERFAKIEPFLHLNAWTWGLGTAIASLPLKLFNPAGWSCFIAPNPGGCTPSWGTGDEEPNCHRGDNAHYYLWLFFYGPLWIVILLVTFCMIWVYWSVLEEEKQIVDDATEDQNETKPKKSPSRRIANRAGLYVCSFYFTWIIPTIAEINFLRGKDITGLLVFLSAVFIPLQGFLNLVIYTLPAFAKYRKRDYVKYQFIILIWFEMIAFELGCFDGPAEDELLEKDDNKSKVSKRGLEKGPMTMSDWMNNPHGLESPSLLDPAT